LAYFASTPRVALGQRGERRPPALELLLVDEQVERAVRDVDPNPVTGGHEADRAAVDGLRCHVADAQACRAAGEPAIGDEHDVLAQPCALDRTGDHEHLAHTRSTLRAFVADDNDISGLNRPVLEGRHR
jgi:hypothetical protein